MTSIVGSNNYQAGGRFDPATCWRYPFRLCTFRRSVRCFRGPEFKETNNSLAGYCLKLLILYGTTLLSIEL